VAFSLFDVFVWFLARLAVYSSPRCAVHSEPPLSKLQLGLLVLQVEDPALALHILLQLLQPEPGTRFVLQQ